jgi:septal ring factor EnvC (AmiA/AmiB activator)
MSSAIIEALKTLDPKNDEHWTGNGDPVIAVVSELIKDPKLKRAQITEAAPEFNRNNLVLPGDKPDTASLPSLESLPKEEQDQVNAILNDDKPFNAPEPDDGATPGPETTELDQARAEVDRLNAEVTEANRAIEAAKQHAAEKTNELAAAEARMHALIPNNDNQSAIQAYIAQQNADRAARAASRQAIFQGIDPRTLDPRSPIDQAFGRKTQRGTQRPARPVTGE